MICRVAMFFLIVVNLTPILHAQEVRLSRGLVAVAESASACNRTGSISFIIKNTSQRDVDLLLVGSKPVMTDNIGSNYNWYSNGTSGIAKCTLLRAHTLAACIGRPTETHRTMPLEAWTRVSANSSVPVNMRFGLNGNRIVSHLSVSMTMAYRVIENSDADRTMSDSKKRRSIRTMSVGLSRVPVGGC